MFMNRIVIAIIFAVVLVGGAFVMTKGGSVKTGGGGGNVPSVPNVSIVDGIQIVDVTAKGGYTPRKSTAKAGIPTILRFNTKGTFDCSSTVRIPSLNIGKQLAITGATDIDLGSPVAGVLKGSCGMGMYPFEIDFQS
jgi:plastocyanin domain-containing protein